MDFNVLKKEFENAIKNDSSAQYYLKMINSGKAGYTTATLYSKAVGDCWSKVLQKAFKEYTGDSFVDYDDINGPVKKALEAIYNEVSSKCMTVQTQLNENAGLGIKAVKPKLNTERINDFGYKLGSDEFDKTEFLLGEDSMENFSRSAVSDSIESNAEFQSEAGLKSYIERSSGGGCCAWCDSMAGRYEYGQQPADFFRVHKDCTCEITFMPARRTWQKINYSTSNGVRTKRTTNVN